MERPEPHRLRRAFPSTRHGCNSRTPLHRARRRRARARRPRPVAAHPRGHRIGARRRVRSHHRDPRRAPPNRGAGRDRRLRHRLLLVRRARRAPDRHPEDRQAIHRQHRPQRRRPRFRQRHHATRATRSSSRPSPKASNTPSKREALTATRMHPHPGLPLLAADPARRDARVPRTSPRPGPHRQLNVSFRAPCTLRACELRSRRMEQDRSFASAWRRDRLTVEERVARGKAARGAAPRSSLGHFEPASDRPDPVTVLEAQGASRVPELVPIRYGRMLDSPFTFYRGAAAIMAADLAAHAPIRRHRAALRRRAPVELRTVRHARTAARSSTSTTSTRRCRARGNGTSSAWPPASRSWAVTTDSHVRTDAAVVMASVRAYRGAHTRIRGGPHPRGLVRPPGGGPAARGRRQRENQGAAEQEGGSEVARVRGQGAGP